MTGAQYIAEKRKLRPKTDPMIRAARKAYKGSKQHKLDLLLAEKTKWARKQTIADNKLWRVNRDIADFLQEEINGGKLS